MNRWFTLLSRASPEYQRLVARYQRVSLPRGCSQDERLLRLRAALCSAAAVRSVYATLDDACRAALTLLQERRGALPVAELTRRFGPLRSYRQLHSDLRPQSVAERLFLLGWLIPQRCVAGRPVTVLLAPELRRWMPLPLQLVPHGPAPLANLPMAVRVAHGLLLLAAAAPLQVRHNGMLCQASLRRLAMLLASDMPEVREFSAFVLPLLQQLGLIWCVDRLFRTTPAAATFLNQPVEQQAERLCRAWIACPGPDRWLLELRLAVDGVDWPLLRRRLRAWIEQLPHDILLDPNQIYQALVATNGPLADQQTHGFRRLRRPPWSPIGAARAFHAALAGPLAWLGLVAWHASCVARPTALGYSPIPWQYDQPDRVVVSPMAVDSDALVLSVHGSWVHGDQQQLTMRINPAAGADRAALLAVLMRRIGFLPSCLQPAATSSPPAVRLLDGVLVCADDPAVLSHATRVRSVRRHVHARPGPGVALVARDAVAPLQRAMHRTGIAVHGVAPDGSVRERPPAGFTASECAVLLAACAFYRRHGPADQSILVDTALESRLRACLPERLRMAVEASIAQLEAPTEQAATPDKLQIMQQALATGSLVTIDYARGGTAPAERRTIRPLELEQSGDAWYLRAFCLLRQAERVFRVDRIGRAFI